MKAAERLFADRRFHEVTLDEVAKASSVGKGTIYRHFADKDDLFFQTATSGFDDLCELLKREVPGDAPFAERLLGACLRIREFFDRHRPLFRLMQAEEGRAMRRRGVLKKRWLAHRRKLASALGDIMRQGMAARELRTDVEGEVLAVCLMGMLRVDARDLADTEAKSGGVEAVLDLFLRGAAARPSDGHGIGAKAGASRPGSAW